MQFFAVPVHGSCILKLSGTGLVRGPSKKGNRTETGPDFKALMLASTRRLLQRISETGLSLSATKSKFFMTEATFAGGRVGPDGIKPDLTKLIAIADWKRPKDLQNLGSFLGLTGHFRSLIKGYEIGRAHV